MILTRLHLELYNPCTRDILDKRKIIAKAVFSYLDKNGVEYRKSFLDVKNTSEKDFWKNTPLEINQNEVK